MLDGVEPAYFNRYIYCSSIPHQDREIPLTVENDFTVLRGIVPLPDLPYLSSIGR